METNAGRTDFRAPDVEALARLRALRKAQRVALLEMELDVALRELDEVIRDFKVREYPADSGCIGQERGCPEHGHKCAARTLLRLVREAFLDVLRDRPELLYPGWIVFARLGRAIREQQLPCLWDEVETALNECFLLMREEGYRRAQARLR